MELKVHGTWSSSFCIRVILALKLKGIPYEYVEEDLQAKSQLLLQYNPVHKKVPILVHNGRPIAESMVILGYIEDNWKDAPLLPEDPYKRARVRFWANFFDQKFFQSFYTIVMTEGEDQEKALREFFENLRLLEEGIETDFSGAAPFFNGQTPGFLDIVIGSAMCSHRAIEEAIGFKLIDRQTSPRFSSWLAALKDVDVMKETLPPHDKLTERVRVVRKKFLQVPKV